MKALDIFRMVAKEFSDIPDNDKVDDSGAILQYGVQSFIDLYAVQFSK